MKTMNYLLHNANITSTKESILRAFTNLILQSTTIVKYIVQEYLMLLKIPCIVVY